MHTVLTAELRLCQQDCSCSPALSKGKNPEPCHLKCVYASPHHLGEEKGAACPGTGMMLRELQWCGGKTVDGYKLPLKNGREEEELELHFMYERCLSMWRSAMETTSSIKWIETGPGNYRASVLGKHRNESAWKVFQAKWSWKLGKARRSYQRQVRPDLPVSPSAKMYHFSTKN